MRRSKGEVEGRDERAGRPYARAMVRPDEPPRDPTIAGEGLTAFSAEITQLLVALRQGQHDRLNELLSLVYEQLHAMAHRRLGPGPRGATLDTTALVHEAYLKLFDTSQLAWSDRKHFFAVAAMAMRQIVVDEARRRSTRKHGGHLKRVDLDASALALDEQSEQLLALDRALVELARLDERMARVVEMHFFGGYSLAEIAEALGVGKRTVDRDWSRARAALYRSMREDAAP